MNQCLIFLALSFALAFNLSASTLMEIDMGAVDNKNLGGKLKDKSWSQLQQDGEQSKHCYCYSHHHFAVVGPRYVVVGVARRR